MEWSVKKGMTGDILYGEDGKTAAFIRRRAGEYQILGADQKLICRLRKQTPLELKIEGAEKGRAVITCAAEHSLFCPPMAKCAEVSWGAVSIVIEQSRKRDYTVLREETVVGTVTGIMGCMARLWLRDTVSPGLAALIYALCLNMLHEDDIEII